MQRIRIEMRTVYQRRLAAARLAERRGRPVTIPALVLAIPDEQMGFAGYLRLARRLG